MIIDSHCHLTYEPMFSSLEKTINKAENDGVKYILTISTENKSFDKILNIVSSYKNVFGTYGIHPHESKLHREINSEKIIEKIRSNKKIIGIGESGLDFFYNHSDKDDQIISFEEHITAAQELDITIIVHTRSAEIETYEILKKRMNKKKFKVLIHCFTGTEEFALKLIDIGAYISASGIITFKNSKNLANTFKLIPNNKILVETDAPYLAPIPFRGKPNEPSYIIHTVKFLSKLKGVSFEEFSNITSNNFFKLFGNISEK